MSPIEAVALFGVPVFWLGYLAEPPLIKFWERLKGEQ